MNRPTKAALLKRVSVASARFEAARKALREAVHMALDDGATWSEIGATLGVSRQAAFDRFGPKHGPPPQA